MKRFLTYLKGLAVGFVDIIPGVSGGTLILIFGMYREFIETIRNVSLKPLLTYLFWRLRGSPSVDRDSTYAILATLNLPFLLPLLAGIACALLLGSLIVPAMMSNYPTITRGFFFGLIAGSFYLPLRLVAKDRGAGDPSSVTRTLVVVTLVLGVLLGYAITNPNGRLQAGIQWKTTHVAQGERLEDLVHRVPSALPLNELYWDPHNAPLRDALRVADPGVATQLSDNQHSSVASNDQSLLKAQAAPYAAIRVAPGTPVEVPVLSYWGVFGMGSVAICAMVLPGISGSYLLLIMGGYFFILNTLKGFVSGLAAGEFHGFPFLILLLFGIGMLTGIAFFSRFLSYLLRHYCYPTMGFLTGMMVGSLRGVWPFRSVDMEGGIRNVFPYGEVLSGSGEVWWVIVAVVVGILLVTLLARVELSEEVE